MLVIPLLILDLIYYFGYFSNFKVTEKLKKQLVFQLAK